MLSSLFVSACVLVAMSAVVLCSGRPWFRVKETVA